MPALTPLHLLLQLLKGLHLVPVQPGFQPGLRSALVFPAVLVSRGGPGLLDGPGALMPASGQCDVRPDGARGQRSARGIHIKSTRTAEVGWIWIRTLS